MKGGVGFDYFENYSTWPPGRRTGAKDLPRDVKLVLDGARSVQIRASDSSDRPVSGTLFAPWMIKKADKISYVNLSGDKVAAITGSRTNADGVAMFDWFPAQLNLESQVDFLLRDQRYHLSNEVIFNPKERKQELDGLLVSAVRVSGKVVTPHGDPAPGILIRAEGNGYNGRSRCIRHVRTSSDGTYELNLSPGQSYVMAVIDDKWAALSHVGLVVAVAGWTRRAVSEADSHGDG